MDTYFLRIAVTRPEFFLKEATTINNLICCGEVDFVHIRKPHATKEEVIRLLKQISPEHYPHIKLHDYFELAIDFSLGGVHLNKRNSEPPTGVKAISKSIHSFEEIASCKNLDYFFISPVFDSISKKDYKAAFPLNELSKNIQGTKAIALGGVKPDKFPLLKSLGFYGAALLSHYFPNNN